MNRLTLERNQVWIYLAAIALGQRRARHRPALRVSAVAGAGRAALLGLGDLHDAVRDHLDTVSFAITTRYQRSMTLLQFWLTVVFGATEIGFIASGIATWYYRAELGAVLVLLLRGKVE